MIEQKKKEEAKEAKESKWLKDDRSYFSRKPG